MTQRSRRLFLKKSGIATLGIMTSPAWLNAAFNNLKPAHQIAGKHVEMVMLNDRPLNMEAPPHLLSDRITPADKFFVRNNGNPPRDIDPDQWKLTIDGESALKPRSYSIAELKEKFTSHTYQLTIECGGNGRSEFNPPAKGNQWTTGAIASSKWTGIRLKDVLDDVGIKEDAVYIGYYGADTHLSNDPGKIPISRGVPMSKALEDETLIAWSLNGEEIPLQNGYPLRLVIGGWPGSVSGKWLNRIAIRNIVHDGPKMTGDSYRVPCKPVSPGEYVEEENMCIIESMPVKSLITIPKTGAMINEGKKLNIGGHAWAGDNLVREMHYSIDFGVTWKRCKLEQPVNRFAWQQWSASVNFPTTGYYELWARATDDRNRSQPMVVPGWNPKGYLNNACHRIAVKVI